jgi:dTDP-glucose 4,6-dehydratase
MGMKILITGAGGFIGSHLAEQCVEAGFDVRAFVRYNSSGTWGWLEQSHMNKGIWRSLPAISATWIP